MKWHARWQLAAKMRRLSVVQFLKGIQSLTIITVAVTWLNMLPTPATPPMVLQTISCSAGKFADLVIWETCTLGAKPKLVLKGIQLMVL